MSFEEERVTRGLEQEAGQAAMTVGRRGEKSVVLWVVWEVLYRRGEGNWLCVGMVGVWLFVMLWQVSASVCGRTVSSTDIAASAMWVWMGNR